MQFGLRNFESCSFCCLLASGSLLELETTRKIGSPFPPGIIGNASSFYPPGMENSEAAFNSYQISSMTCPGRNQLSRPLPATLAGPLVRYGWVPHHTNTSSRQKTHILTLIPLTSTPSSSDGTEFSFAGSFLLLALSSSIESTK